MRRFVAIVAVCMLGLLPVLAQHGRGMGASSQGMGHSRIGQGSANASGQTKSGGRKSPSDQLASNTKLSGKLQSLLPAGTSMQDACSGFKNLGQCVAAVHVSHNLGMSFTDLKTKMLGTAAMANAPATPGMSLGKAIQTLDPHADAKAEVTKATKQAKDDLSDKG